MPAPVVIRDNSPPHESQRGASTTSGEDPVVPLKNIASVHQADRPVLPPRSSNGDDQTEQRNKQLWNDMNNDIATSPRLLGYVFSFISSAVSTISSTVFYFRETTEADPEVIRKYSASLGGTLSVEQMEGVVDRIEGMHEEYQLYFGSGGDVVKVWKVYGCIAVSGLLTVITSAIVIAHFDSLLCVKKNRVSFGDGSKVERNILLILICLCVCSLYISTSKFSVGEAQANVFFSTWTNFVSCAVNYEVWRKGSGLNLTFQDILLGQKRHWFFLSIFTTIGFLSTIDFYFSNRIADSSHNFACLDVISGFEWIWFSLAGAVACWGIVLLHQFSKPSLLVTILEVITSLAIIGCDGYAVSEFTGVRLGQVRCPSNLYFSAWIAFFLSVWILGTIIQESGSLARDQL